MLKDSSNQSYCANLTVEEMHLCSGGVAYTDHGTTYSTSDDYDNDGFEDSFDFVRPGLISISRDANDGAP